MRIKGFIDMDISFKQTTSKRFKCRGCSSCVDGVDGYIKIRLYRHGAYTENDMIVMCNKCFGEWMDEIEKMRVNKAKNYEGLIKKGILKSLK